MTGGILIYVEDPGAANWIVPLSNAGCLPTLMLYCEPPLLAYFAARGVAATPIADAITAGDLLAKSQPSLVLVGTSENLASRGLDLIDAAAAAGIPSASFVDQGANAEHRFRGTTANPLAHAPDWLFVADSAAADAFAALGLPRRRIVVSGNPHLDRVRAAARNFAREGRRAVRARVAPGAPTNRSLVVFLAEIGYVVNPERTEWEAELNFAGRTGDAPRCARILEEVLDVVATLASQPWLVLRLHPKNRRDEFAAYAGEIDQVSEGGDPLGLFWAADLVIGMSSAPVEEAHAMGRPVLSVLPHPVERTWLPGLADGSIPIVDNSADLRCTLPDLLMPPVQPSFSLPAADTAAQRIQETLVRIAGAH